MKLKSMRAKLLVFFIPVSVVVLVTVGLIVALLARNVTYNQAVDLSAETMTAASRIIEEWLMGVKNEMRNLANTDVVRSFYPDFLSQLSLKRSNKAGEFTSLFF